jgi:hypothetical protein
LRQALTVAQSATKKAQKHLARRLQLLYERGEVEPIEILLGSRSLDEAMASIDNLKGMTKQDAMVLREVTGARTAYGVDARKLASRVAVLPPPRSRRLRSRRRSSRRARSAPRTSRRSQRSAA